MKLLIAVVHSEDASATMDALNDRGISVTKFASSGGFLQHKNVTLMSGIEEDRIEEVLAVIKENCRTRSEFMNPMPPLVEPGDFFVPYPVEVQVGGATVFIVTVEKGDGARTSHSGFASRRRRSSCAHSTWFRMAARAPASPRARSVNHSLSARKRRPRGYP